MNARTQRASRLGLAAVLAVSLSPWLALGQSAPTNGGASGRPTAGETPPEAAARAKQHFQKGRELYYAGSYREAIVEFEAARSLDPHAKDLVFNLAIVNEKLGQIDPAIRYVHVYMEMDLDAQERTKADAYLKRLEGAKKEVVPIVAPTPTATSTATPPPSNETSQPHGRVEAAAVTAAAFAVGGVAVGTIFGIKALKDQPPSTFVTGKDGTLQQYQADQQHAHTEAIVSDVGFGVGVAAAAIAAYLYFGRTKERAPARSETTVSAGPVTDGGHGAVLVVVGSF
jgi:tetratricopeptide (TPR) repeat protein